MLKRLGLGFDKAVFERPLTGSGGMVVPPILANQVAHKHSCLLGCYDIAERDRVLAGLRPFLNAIVDVALTAPDAQPFVSCITAGVLIAATQASHVRSD